MIITYHGIKHHPSYISQDCGNKLYSCVFSDSPVMTKISCGRTKSEALVMSVLLPFAQKSLPNNLKNTPFSIGSDASNKATKNISL